MTSLMFVRLVVLDELKQTDTQKHRQNCALYVGFQAKIKCFVSDKSYRIKQTVGELHMQNESDQTGLPFNKWVVAVVRPYDSIAISLRRSDVMKL